MKAALTGVQAAQAASLADAGGATGSMAGVNLSYGSQSSRSEQTSTQTQSQGSSLTAGNNLTVNATGTDINVQGSRLQAGKDISLGAARDVNLISAQNTQRLDGKNESHGGSVGVGINVGQGSNGPSLNASVNKGRGSETGNGTTHSETTAERGQQPQHHQRARRHPDRGAGQRRGGEDKRRPRPDPDQPAGRGRLRREAAERQRGRQRQLRRRQRLGEPQPR